jgi:hypothetical protein
MAKDLLEVEPLAKSRLCQMRTACTVSHAGMYTMFRSPSLVLEKNCDGQSCHSDQFRTIDVPSQTYSLLES